MYGLYREMAAQLSNLYKAVEACSNSDMQIDCQIWV